MRHDMNHLEIFTNTRLVMAEVELYPLLSCYPMTRHSAPLPLQTVYADSHLSLLS